MKQKTKVSAFTLVELMVSIAIVGILTTIVTVSYSGAQVKARNTERVAAAQTYINLMRSYVLVNNVYPQTGGPNYACLGDGFPDITGDGVGDCYDLKTTGSPYNLASEVPSFTNMLKSLNSNSLPKQNKNPVIENDGTKRVGPVYNQGGKEIIFFLEGDTAKCDVSFLRLQQSGNNVTYCYVQLP